MNFKKWLIEVGMGGGGPGSGLSPPKQNPTSFSGSFADFHDETHKDPRNSKGQLPPVKKKMKK